MARLIHVDVRVQNPKWRVKTPGPRHQVLTNEPARVATEGAALRSLTVRQDVIFADDGSRSYHFLLHI